MLYCICLERAEWGLAWSRVIGIYIGSTIIADWVSDANV